jgi:hypothetical protein
MHFSPRRGGCPSFVRPLKFVQRLSAGKPNPFYPVHRVNPVKTPMVTINAMSGQAKQAAPSGRADRDDREAVVSGDVGVVYNGRVGQNTSRRVPERACSSRLAYPHPCAAAQVLFVGAIVHRMTMFQRVLCRLAALAICVAATPSAIAHEPVGGFLAALRANGYHDMAIEYLQRIAKSPQVDDQFKRRYEFELGSVLLESAKTAEDPLLADRLASQGIEKLKAFLAAKPEPDLALAASSKLAEEMLGRGRVLVARAARSRDRQPLLLQARGLFTEAAEMFQAVEKLRVAEFERRSPQADREERNRLGAPILEARLRTAEAASDVAQTYDAGSAEFKQALQQGIDRYAALYEKYADQGFVAAFAARLREAENQLQLGKADKALAAVKSVLERVDEKNETLRDPIVTPAYLVAMKAWREKGEYGAIVENAAAYAANPGAAESKRPDWQELQYLLALAYQQHAQSLKSTDPKRVKFETEARRLAGQVIKQKSDVQDDARVLLGKLGRAVEQNPGDAKTFDEAVQKATAALQDYTGAKALVEHAAENDKAGPLQQVSQARDAAYHAASHALLLADAKSDLAKVNTLRFYLAYLHWEYGQAESRSKQHSSHFADAAVLGEYLARRFPEHASARQSMAVAIAAYQMLRQQALEDARSAETPARAAGGIDPQVAAWSEKLSQLAEYAVEKWPDTEEAASALGALASVAIEQQNFDRARRLVEKLKEGSARRTATELMLGRSIWANYVRAKKATESPQASQSQAPDAAPPASDPPVTKEALRQWASQAQALLESGLKGAKESGQIDRAGVLGMWALVQLYVTTSQPQKAIPWLEDEKIGLLALVNDKNEAADVEGLMFDAYRLALRAYIAVKPQQLDKALSTMDALEKITGNDAKGREMLTGVYVAMGRDLQQEMQDLAALGDTQGVAALSTAFQAFLERLVARDTGVTFNSLFWVADTYLELAAGLGKNAAEGSPERARSGEFYRQAVAAFEKIAKRAEAEPTFMPEKYLPLVQMRLAKAYRGADDYEQALALLSGILKEKPNVLDLQFESAYTYQELAASNPKKNGKYFRYAILGGQSEGMGQIWGWNALASKIRSQQERLRTSGDTAAAEKYDQRYHEARYNSAYCAYSLASAAGSDSEKKRLLNIAKQGMWSVYAIVDPQFGGGEWKAKNERLLRDIQSALGEAPLGLRAFEQKKQEQASVSAAK